MRSMTASSHTKQKPQQSCSCRFTLIWSETAQGLLPEAMYVVPPGETFEPERYRVLDYAAYYRYVKSRLEAVIGANGPGLRPIPNPHRTARSAGGNENAIRNAVPTIIYPS